MTMERARPQVLVRTLKKSSDSSLFQLLYLVHLPSGDFNLQWRSRLDNPGYSCYLLADRISRDVQQFLNLCHGHLCLLDSSCKKRKRREKEGSPFKKEEVFLTS